MARECRRLLLEPGRLAVGGPVHLEPAEAHYLRRVLRLRAGDRVELVDGAGRLWSALLEPADQLRLEQPVAEPLRCQPPASLPLQLLVVPPRRDADAMVRMLCELGVDRITLLRSRRRVAPPTPAERTLTIVREACEQCERLWLPRLELERPLPESLGPRATPASPGLWATTRLHGLPELSQALVATAEAARECGVALSGVRLAVGPEGGWSPEEEGLAISLGWQPVSLGRGILRTSTAAVAAAALLAAWRG